MSPDPENAGADAGNPQSWNAYAYVLNNPLIFIDPSGLLCVDSNGVGMVDAQGSPLDENACAGKGAWITPMFTEVQVKADPLPDGSSFGEWLSGWWDSFNSLDRATISTNLNRCAAPLAQTKSLTAISHGKIPELLGSNDFSDVSALANGVGGADQAAPLGTTGAIEVAKEAGPKLAIRTVTGIAKPISATSGVYNPVTVGTSTQSLGGTIGGKLGFGALKAVTLAKFAWDAGNYLGAEGACAVYAWKQ